LRARSARYALIAFGWICIAVGVIGIVVPGLPTTVFLLMAAWAFSRSSERFQNWLLAHPRLGPPVIDWRERGAIPVRAKILAVAMMSASFAWIVLYVAHSWEFPAAIGVVMAGGAAFVVTRPNA
jgi:uncharacterized membrane protein YbaN (DUF454 family)